jgi:hypothetical protein
MYPAACSTASGNQPNSSHNRSAPARPASGHSDRTTWASNSTASPAASMVSATVSTARQPERRRLVITTVPVRTRPNNPATSCGLVTS